MRASEEAFGLADLQTYEGFQERAMAVRASLRQFLDEARRAGRTVVGYGAAAKGNTLLNYAGITGDDLAYVVDRSPKKQGRHLPGSRLPIHAPSEVRRTEPDILLVLAWNLLDEIMAQMSFVREWGCQFVVPIPHLHAVE